MARTICELVPPRQPSAPHWREGGQPVGFACTGPSYTTVLLWNRVSNQEPSGSGGGTLSPGQCDPAFPREAALFASSFCMDEFSDLFILVSQNFRGESSLLFCSNPPI
ncbi:hypothetical protein AVEN_116421-1 [Araneus ventricosus]|uniref:Uncharacterized protein n=1 Tax=Araneus ventricosus TaxID=182803 RepID=A0A4Y2KIT2_ARAVE|nr:hypothetical protein AVEN_116421-1 [Araneus ventricosus]